MSPLAIGRILRGLSAHPALQVLRDRPAFWSRLADPAEAGRVVRGLLPFMAAACACYGAAAAGWRSPRLAAYVAAKFPIILLGTTALVMFLNGIVASVLGSGLSFRQTAAVTWGAMSVACWILLGLLPVSLFFTWTAAATGGTAAQMRLTHNLLLLTQILLIAVAGIAGNAALLQGLRRVVRRGCPVDALHACWLAAFLLVGCELSWVLRPFIGSPFYPVRFMRPDALERNFYEFVFTEVVPFVGRGGR
jgi:hypothetical protein